MPPRAETELQRLRASLAALVPEGSLALAAFLSGIAALVYQTLWIDVLAGVVGSTTRSLAWVVCTFLVALTLGAAAFGRTERLARTPRRVFAALELSLGVLAVGSVLALRSTHALALSEAVRRDR